MLTLVLLLSSLFGSLKVVSSADEASTDSPCSGKTGVIPNPEDCSSYYICTNGITQAMDCSTGLLFNQLKTTCDFNSSVECNVDIPANDNLIGSIVDDVECATDTCTCMYPSNTSCSEYYRCENGVPYKESCPAGLAMNPLKLTCDYENNVQCDIPTTTKDTNSDATDPATTVTLGNLDAHTETSAENLDPSLPTPSNINTFGSTTTLGIKSTKEMKPESSTIPNEESTFEISGETEATEEDLAIETTSVESTVPTSDTNLIPSVTQSDDQMVSDGKRPSSESSGTSIPTPQSVEPDTTYADSTYAPSTYADSTYAPSTYADSTYAPSTYAIDEITIPSQSTTEKGTSPSHLTEFTSEGTTFSQSTLDIDMVTSSRRQRSSTDLQHSTLNESSTESLVMRSSQSPTPEVTPTRIICNNNVDCPDTTTTPTICLNPNGFYPNPANCSSFYQCKQGTPLSLVCIANEHFSPMEFQCMDPCKALCDLTLACVETPKSDQKLDPECRCMNCLLPDPETCTKFIECRNGVATKRPCRKGQTFDSKREVCDWEHRVNCSHTETCPRRNGLFPYEGDCRKFIHCANGIPYVNNCPRDDHFDPSSLKCTRPSGKCGSSPPEIAELGKVNPQLFVEMKWQCPSSFGYFRHEGDCKKFYQCSHGDAIPKECPKNLFFNSKDQTCDWEKNVRCDKDQRHLKRRCRQYNRSIRCALNITYVVHPHCDMFYDCTSMKACPRRCPIGLFFNSDILICDQPTNVRCRKRDGGFYNLNNFAELCLNKKRGQMQDYGNESCFYKCHDTRVERRCCPINRVYNEQRAVCERKHSSHYP